MERLTFDGNFCDIAQCRDSACKQDGTCTQKDVWKRLKAYEDTGLTPERCAEFARADAEGRYIVMRDAEQEGVARLREIAEADKDGRVVVLPCKVGERWVDEDGRAVRTTAVIVSMEPFGENIDIYCDYEDATPDDAGSDCVTNWDHFSRIFTCAETVLDNRKDAENA